MGTVSRNDYRATLAKRRADVARMFDGVAERYDVANTVLSLGLEKQWRKDVLAAIRPRRGQVILDLAAGTGVSSVPLVKAGATVIPTDMSIGMIEAGRKTRPDLPFVVGDALALPYADESFDAVSISFGLRNVTDTPAALEEMYRVMKPGGTLVICEFSTPTFGPFRYAYRTYLGTALRGIARVASSNAPAYDYLRESILAWPDQEGLATLIDDSGFERIEWRNLAGGIVALHRAQRPEA